MMTEGANPNADANAFSTATAAKKGAVLGKPFATLPDGTRLGASGRAIKGQDTPTTRAANTAPATGGMVRAVEPARSFVPVAKPLPAALAPRDASDIEGPRLLTESLVRACCEALSIAAQLTGEFAENDIEGDTYGVIAGILNEKADRYSDALSQITRLAPYKPPQAPLPVPAGPSPVAVDFSRMSAKPTIGAPVAPGKRHIFGR